MAAAHDDTASESPMPVTSGHNERIAAIAHRHGVSAVDIAAGTGLSESFISRVLDGQYSVPPDVTRFLYRRTGDPEIAEVALGCEQAPGDTRAARLACQLARVASRLLSVASVPGPLDELDRVAAAAAADLQRARASVSAPQPTSLDPAA